MVLVKGSLAAVWYLYASSIQYTGGTWSLLGSAIATDAQCRTSCSNDATCVQYLFFIENRAPGCYKSTTLAKLLATTTTADPGYIIAQKVTPGITYTNYNAIALQALVSIPWNSFYPCYGNSNSDSVNEDFTTCGSNLPSTWNRAIDGTFCKTGVSDQPKEFSCDPTSHLGISCPIGSGLLASGSCVACTSPQYSPGGSSACVACTAAGFKTCSPTTGFPTSCQSGTGLSLSAGVSACTGGSCSNSYSDGTTPCQKCPDSSTICGPSTPTPTGCVSPSSGFNSLSKSCYSCASLSPSSSSISPCGCPAFANCYIALNGQTAITSCKSGYRLGNDGSCFQCTGNTYSLGGQTTPAATCNTCASLQTGVLTCDPKTAIVLSCNGGYGFNAGRCTSCGTTAYSDGTTDCKPCTAGTYCGPSNIAPTGCTSLSTGYYGSSGCINCLLYSPASSSTGQCTCPSHGQCSATLNPPSYKLNTCDAGFGPMTNVCLDCSKQAGSYNPGNLGQGCYACPGLTTGVMKTCDAITGAATSCTSILRYIYKGRCVLQYCRVNHSLPGCNPP